MFMVPERTNWKDIRWDPILDDEPFTPANVIIVERGTTSAMIPMLPRFEADRDIASGRVKRFNSIGALIASLDAPTRK